MSDNKGQDVTNAGISPRVLAGGALVAAAAAAWAGLQVEPPPFPPVTPPSSPPETIPLPTGLPAPVQRYYRVTYGDQIPVIRSAVLSGRGKLSLFGVRFPMRFRFFHEAARNFRATFELSVFAQPIMKVNEHFVHGKFRQELPFGVEEGQPKIDHSAAIRMWAEWALWLPAMLLRDPDVRWQPIADDMALLVVPYAGGQEHLIVRFEPSTGKVQYVEGMKYKQATDPTKTLWINAVWFGDKPWASFDIESIVLNAPVDTSLTAEGP